MIRLAVPILLTIGLLATPTVRAMRQDAKARPQYSAEKTIAALHNTIFAYEKDLRTTPFREVLDDMEKNHKLRFLVNKPAIGDAAVQIDTAKAETLDTKELDGMTLGAFLTLYLRSVPIEDLTYLVRDQYIEITSKAAMAKEVGFDEDMEEAMATGDAGVLARAKARQQLPIVSISAKQQAMSAAFEELRRAYSLNIVLDPAAKGELKTEITLKLLNVPADTALELLAGQADLGVVRNGNTFRIISNPGA